MRVGLDDLNLYAGSLRIEASQIARARGTPLETLARFQILRRSLTPAFEDPVTLAVNAARPIVEAAGRDSFELLIVATESGVDFGKPLSSYVHRWLELPTRCRNLEVKHACFAATASLQLAASWLRGGAPPGKKALVVATDMARQIFGDPAEAAEGAGAVAFSMSREPRLLALDERTGIAAREVYDVTRPTPTLERANAGLSLGAYLDLLEAAFLDYQAQTGASLDDFAWLAFHTPLVPLVERGHRLIYELCHEDAERSEIARDFEKRVHPSVSFCQETGNLYGGSLYEALAGLISFGASGRVGMYSYGSGSCAEFFSGTILPGARDIVARHRIGERLQARREVGFEEYHEQIRAMEALLTAGEYTPPRERPDGLFAQAYQGRNLLVLAGVSDYYRSYAWS
jgi:3-hydroxy-3-methylglutaryl CoA synthase